MKDERLECRLRFLDGFLLDGFLDENVGILDGFLDGFLWECGTF